MRLLCNTIFKVLSIAMIIGTSSSYAQELSRQELTAAYLYNFIQNVHWPNETEIKNFNLTIISDDDDLKRQFSAFSQDKTIRSKKIHLNINKDYDYVKSHIIFIDKDYSSLVSSVLDEIKNRPVLLITDNYEYTDQIMINLIDSPDNRLLFEINQMNIVNHNLTVLSEMILLGGREVDLVALFEEYQNQNIRLLKQQEILQMLISGMRDTVDVHKAMIQDQKNFIRLQQDQITKVKSEIKTNLEDLERLRSSVIMQKLIQDSLANDTYNKQLQLVLKDSMINTRNQVLNQQEQQIEAQRNEISQQLETLDEQGGVIESQSDTILLLFLAIVLAVILVVVSFYGFMHIRKINSNLQKVIAEREQFEQELIVANKDLSEVNKELESFSYSVSHDLRAPLRAISGFSQIFFEEYSSDIGDEAKRLLSIIKMNSEKMSQLIDDLLKFSRLGRGSLKYEQIDMKQLVNEVIEDLYLNEDHKVEFILENCIDLHANRSMIKLVLTNLVDNAMKYSAESNKPKVIIGSERKQGVIEYAVTDNGVGFDMKYYDKLFGVFQRLHTDLEFKGNGIGLALCKRIISRHNGEIWARAKINEGASFYFSLPE
ncbi:MAG: DUF4154 domain-containing protein [Bacteroidales bacterium]|nr:DUF4154 domain-containing protein [Bacteroidales bacterium]